MLDGPNGGSRAIEFEIRHTGAGLRRIYTGWWRRRFGRAYGVSFAAAVVLFMAMLMLRSAWWPLLAAATLCAAYAAFVTSIRDEAIRLVLEQLELAGPGPLHYRLDAISLREQSSFGESELRWFVFDSLVAIDGALILMRKPAAGQSFVVFPIDQIPPEATRFIEDRLRTSIQNG